MIVIASSEHREDWLRLRTQVYSGLTDQFHHQEISLWLSDPTKQCWIVYEQGEAVAFLEASQRNVVDGCLTSPVGYVEGIYVSQSRRGAGLARLLLATAEQWMREQGCTEIGTDAEITNEAAIAFHKAMGFEETFRVVEFRKTLTIDE